MASRWVQLQAYLPHSHRVPKFIFDRKVTRGGSVKYRVEFEGLGVAHTE